MNAATYKAQDEAFAARMDADNAEYAFNLYCAESPGVKAADVVANMGAKAHTKAFWDAAMYNAMGARAAWLAA